MKNTAVWFKKDLRLKDHRPLVEAAQAGNVFLFYVFDPVVTKDVHWDVTHTTFVLESLHALNQELAQRYGMQIHIFEKPILEVLELLRQHHLLDALYSHEETGLDITYSIDKSVAAYLAKHDIAWLESPTNGVVRRLKDRDQWNSIWQKRMREPVLDPPQRIHPAPVPPSVLSNTSEPNLKDASEPNIDFSLIQKGGVLQAQDVLQSFLSTRGKTYQKSISSPITAQDHGSRLSPYITFGNLSIRQIHEAYKSRWASLEPRSGWATPLKAFKSRLHWHCHFIQKLEDEPEIEFENMCRSMTGLREDDFDEQRFEAWKNAQTGYPMIDACMRYLQQHRWINFRMRAMLVSFASYHLWLHWKPTSTFLARFFLDFEPGIHFSQFQMQSGTTGINAIRMYSPTKQAIDQDPDGNFIRRWCPELADVPQKFIFEPWTMPSSLQHEYGCVIDRQYPAPVVSHKQAYKDNRARVFQWRKRPEVQAEIKKVYARHGSRKTPRMRVS